MGGGVYKHCLGEDPSTINLGSTLHMNGDDNYNNNKEGKHRENDSFYYLNNLDKILKIQNNFIILKSRSLLNKIAENKKIDFDIDLKNFGYYVNFEEIMKRRNLDLFKNESSILPKFNLKESESKLSRNKFLNNSLIFKREPIHLTHENQRIYEGSWSIANFQRLGYGCLYELNGTKIEGYWNYLNIDGKARIYYPDKSIYEGYIKIADSSLINGINDSYVSYIKHGPGVLYYPSGRYIAGVFDNDKISGNYSEFIPNKYKITATKDINGNIEISNKAIIEYSNGSLYKGQINEQNQKHGKGTLTLTNGEKFEGSFKFDKADGPGIHYYPNNDENILNNEKNKKNDKNRKYCWGSGTYIDGNWSKGYLNGKGTIITDKEVKQATWRLGKLISLESFKIELHENIYNFLSLNDLTELTKLKNKAIFKYLSTNNYKKLLRIRLLQIIKSNSKIINNEIKNGQEFKNEIINTKQSFYKSEFDYNYNKELLNIIENSLNIEEFIKNYNENKDEFIPIEGFYTNGGCVNRFCHYSNTFNPNQQNFYHNNFNIKDTEKDISIYGVLNPSIYEKGRKNILTSSPNVNPSQKVSKTFGTPRVKVSNNLINKSTIKYFLLFFEELTKLRPISISNIPDIKQLFKISENFKDFYNYNEYSNDYQTNEIFDSTKFKSIINNSNNQRDFNFKHFLFTLHSLTISIPYKVQKYLIMYNPVRTFAIYLYKNLKSLNTSLDTLKENKKESILNYESVHNQDIGNSEFLEQLKNEYSIINLIKSEDFSFIEFDTLSKKNDNIDNDDDQNEKTLLCLIQLKKGEEFAFEFRKYYHLGNFIEVKLIDQNERYKQAKTIDIGTLNFFGQIYKIKEQNY